MLVGERPLLQDGRIRLTSRLRPGDHRPQCWAAADLDEAYDADLDEAYDIEVDGLQVTVRVRNGTVDVSPGSAGEQAAVKVITDRQGFIELARGQAGDRVQIEGDVNALARLQRAFSLG